MTKKTISKTNEDAKEKAYATALKMNMGIFFLQAYPLMQTTDISL